MKVIKLGTTWCGPCKMYSFVFHNVETIEDFKDIEFVSYDIEKELDGYNLAVENGVRTVPTTLLVDDNDNVVFKMLGSVPQKDLEQAIRQKLLPKKEKEQPDKKEEEK